MGNPVGSRFREFLTLQQVVAQTAHQYPGWGNQAIEEQRQDNAAKQPAEGIGQECNDNKTMFRQAREGQSEDSPSSAADPDKDDHRTAQATASAPDVRG